jgi:hypothetical protein
MLSHTTAPAKPPLPLWVKGMLVLWACTLPIATYAALSLWQAAAGGDYPLTHISVGAGFTYPLSVMVAVLFSRKWPGLVFLPLFHIVVWFLAALVAPLEY